jgi:soluble cytochrome b562
MKLRSHKITTILATLALGITLCGHSARAEEKTTPLGDKMKIIAKSVKQLKGQVTDPTKQQSSIQLVEAAKQAATDAKALVPAKAATVPEADRPKFIADFQAQIDVLIKAFTDLDTALQAGKYDDAQKDFNGLAKIKGDGHKAFIKPEN